MNAPLTSPLEGQPLADAGQAAELASPAPAVGAPKGVAEGVRTSLGSNPHGHDGHRAACPLRNSQEGRAA